MKILLTNIVYSDRYKAFAVRYQPAELEVKVPDTITEMTEDDAHMTICKAISKQYSAYLAMGIENADFTIQE